MKLSEPVAIDNDDRRRIYEYIERRGTVPKSEVVDGTVEDRRAAIHHVAVLKRDDYLTETDEGTLEPSLELDAEAEEFTREDVPFVIRPARQKDLTGIVGAIRRVAEEKSYIEAESVADEIDHQDVLLRHNSVESRMFFVATVEDEVVGWTHIHSPEIDKLSHTAELTVGVLDEYQGRNIGSHLLRRATEWAGTNGFEKLYQSVPSTNQDAIDFLEANGWQVEAVREDHYKLGGNYVDEVMMAVTL